MPESEPPPTIPASETSPPAVSHPAPPSPPPDSEPPAGGVSASSPAAGNIEEYEPLTPELVEEEAIRGDFVLRWAVVLLAFLLGSTRIADTATLIHVKTGQYLAEHGILPPAHDVFSYTARDRPWTNLSWGFDLVMAGIHALASFAGLSVLKALLVAGTFWLIGRISRPGIPSWWGSICGVAALLGCHLRIAAAPILVTFFGISLSMTLMHQWREAASASENRGGSKRLWLFVPLILAWSNFDSRAWLGLAYLVLFAAGDSLGAWLKSPTALSAPARKNLWTVAGASVAATLVHPFGWKSLAAPWRVYAVEYPAFRSYISEIWVGADNPPIGQATIYFPITTASFWTNPDVASIAALAVLAAAGVTFFMNRARHDWGHFAVYLGFLLLAAACLYELPAAAIVGCVLATLNGQAWYATACRQTYSTDRKDVLFSQGGRALTVLAMAAIAFFGGTGRLRDSTGAPARTGYGLDQNLEMQIDDLRQQLAGEASYDHRPFNVLLTQGDQLIWVGEQVFVDSRVGVYYSRNEEDNLLARQLVTREALRGSRPREGAGSPAGVGVPGAGGVSAWSGTFDEYQITHVVLRLLNVRDSELFTRLLQDGRRWEWTSLGPAAAVFYRLSSGNDPQLAAYIDAHKIDFRKRAFHAGEDASLALSARSRGIRAPSFYQKYFWTKRHVSVPEILEAGHLAQLMVFPGLPQALGQSRLAMAYLAIRRAQAGLEKDPDDVSGYLVLGQVYDFLSRIEAAVAMTGSRSLRSEMRYLQAVAAYNQSLVGEPDNPTAHAALMRIYLEAQKPDLALRHMQALDDVLAADPDVNPAELETLEKQIGQARQRLESISGDVTARSGAERDPMKLIIGYLQQQCVLKALAEIDAAGAELAGNLAMEQQRIGLLIEAGRIEEAYDAAGRFAAAADQAPLADWQNIVALANLAYGDYSGATLRWQSAADEAEMQAFNGLLLNLAPHPSQLRWPLSTTASFFNYLFQRPESVAALRMNLALVHLEEGQVELAEAFFRDVLATAPDTVNRPLVAFYLRELTDGKEEIDGWPPSDRIIELFAPEPDAADKPEK
ncbi:MAG: tetratricopeptide repeat protein [Deltaproteobacteria bacterium]